MASLINQNWVFGTGAKLSFSTTVPTASSGALIATFEGCASISDANGNLLLYTDGQTVWDSSNTVRATGLLGNSSSTQSAIIVPDPGNSTQYYIFTADGTTGGNNHVNGIRINVINWQSTLWPALMPTPPTTSGFSSTEKITAIQHANCKDYWVVTIIQALPGGPTNARGIGTFRVFLVTSTGVQFYADTTMPNVNVHDIGYMKASRDGRRIAIANWDNTVPPNPAAPGNALVYPFDNSTGVIDLAHQVNVQVPAITLPGNAKHPRFVYGVEFSPSSNILYYSVMGATGTGAIDNGYVFQHDLLNPLNPSSPLGLHPNDLPGRYALGALQLGPDDRIYIAQDGEGCLGVIANPDVLGLGCNLTFGSTATGTIAGIQLGGATCQLGLPNAISNPCPCACDEGACDAAVDEANQTLNDRADHKSFTIVANGQALPTTCQPAFTQTNFAPIFSIRWGDSAADQFEDEDTEIIYIRVYNPFRNLIFRGVKIFNIRVVPNQVLPNGEDALQLIPAEIACFDGIEPCSHVSRDFAFLLKNAIPQAYQIMFDYCIAEIAIVGSNDGSAVFNINVVAS